MATLGKSESKEKSAVEKHAESQRKSELQRRETYRKAAQEVQKDAPRGLVRSGG